MGQQPPMMMGMPPAPTVDDSQKILAIQNQVSFFLLRVLGVVVHQNEMYSGLVI